MLKVYSKHIHGFVNKEQYQMLKGIFEVILTESIKYNI